MTDRTPHNDSAPESDDRDMTTLEHAIDHLSRQMEQPASPASLSARLERTREALVEQGLATREDAQQAIDILRLDLAALGQHIETRQEEWIDWLKLDVRLLAVGLREAIERAADPTRLGWQKLAIELARQHENHGDVPRRH